MGYPSKMEPKVWKFGASRGFNGMGYVFLVLTGIVVAIALTSKEAPGTMSPTQRLLFLGAPLLIASLLLILKRTDLVYAPDEGKVRVGKEFAPFINWTETPVSGKKTVVLSATRVRGTPIFECRLVFEATPEKFALTTAGSEKDLKQSIDFAREVGAKIVVEPSMQSIGAPWLRKYLPEYK